jgi:DNA end-binding protein Ku
VGPVDQDDIVKGYEVDKGRYVTVADDEVEALRVESRHTIDLIQFVGAHEIDPLYYEKPYFLVPAGEVAQEAYRVIHQALRATGKLGLGQIVLAGREHPVALKPCGRGLLLQTLRSTDEVKKGSPYFAEIEDGPVDEDQLALALQLVERKTARFDPARFVDHYEAALRELIEAKAAGQQTRSKGSAAVGGEVVDLMAALKKSLAEEKAPRGKGGPAEVRDHPARRGSMNRGKSAPAGRPPAPATRRPRRDQGDAPAKPQRPRKSA